MSSTDTDLPGTPEAITPQQVVQTMHWAFVVVWGGLFLVALVVTGFGMASAGQTYDAGPLTHEAQAGVDFLAAGIIAATGLIVLMIQLGTRIVQLTLLGGSRD